MKHKYSDLQFKKSFLFKPLIIVLLVDLIIIFSVYIYNEMYIALEVILAVLLATMILYVFPLLYLFLNYRKENKNATIEILDNSFIYLDAKRKIKFSISEIKEVVINLSIPMYNDRIRLFYWDEYFYFLIKLKSGKDVFITCLLSPNFDKFIPKNLIIKKERVFPIICKN